MEGGHEDHDTCNLIAKNIKKNYKIKNFYQFLLYNSFDTSIIFFKVFNPINKKNVKKIYSSLLDRLFLIKLLFNYTSQIKTWLGLYPFIIFHYLIKGYNSIEKLNSDKLIIKPHSGKLLYEKETCANFQYLKKGLIFY